MGMPSQEQVTLLTDYDATSAYSTAYQALYTNIRFNWDNEETRQHTILLTTPATYTGRAAAAANIAIAAAQDGMPTILVDADLHAPGLQQRFGLGEHPGLSDLLLEGTITPQKIVPFLQKTFIPELALLGTGSKTQQAQEASHHLSAKLKDVIDGLRQLLNSSESRPALIIFNSPPVLSGIDASVIGASVDQTFLLIATGQTTRTQARKAHEQLERVHAKMAGLIMLDA